MKISAHTWINPNVMTLHQLMVLLEPPELAQLRHGEAVPVRVTGIDAAIVLIAGEPFLQTDGMTGARMPDGKLGLCIVTTRRSLDRLRDGEAAHYVFEPTFGPDPSYRILIGFASQPEEVERLLQRFDARMVKTCPQYYVAKPPAGGPGDGADHNESAVSP